MDVNIEHAAIDFFEETVNELLVKVFERTPSTVMVTDLSSVGDFSITQEDFDRHLALIKDEYNIDLREHQDYKLLTLCRLIESGRKQSIH